MDDSRLVRVQLEDVLEGTDYEVAAYCRSGEEAIEQYGSVLPDVVTMDIIMQGMDGLDAAEIILRSHPDARIVMISSLAYGDTFERAKAIGTWGFVEKAVPPGAVGAGVRGGVGVGGGAAPTRLYHFKTPFRRSAGRGSGLFLKRSLQERARPHKPSVLCGLATFFVCCCVAVSRLFCCFHFRMILLSMI